MPLMRLADAIEQHVHDGQSVALEGFTRSEEHTSELQSQSNLVCRLLLEKKKTDNVLFYAKASEIFRCRFLDKCSEHTMLDRPARIVSVSGIRTSLSFFYTTTEFSRTMT